MKRIFFPLSLASLLLLFLCCPALSQDDAEEDLDLDMPLMKGIVETLEADENFEILVGAIKISGIMEKLDDMEEGYFTLLAPEDAAFDVFSKEELDKFLKDKDAAVELLSNHILLREMWLDDIIEAETVETLSGNQLGIQYEEEHVFIGNAEVIDADIECNDGVIHAVNAIIIPSEGD